MAPINEIRSAVNQIVSALQNAEQVPGNQVEGKIRDAVQIARNGTIIYSDTAAAALIAKTAEDNQEVAAGVAAYFLQRISQDSSGRQVTWTQPFFAGIMIAAINTNTKFLNVNMDRDAFVRQRAEADTTLDGMKTRFQEEMKGIDSWLNTGKSDLNATLETVQREHRDAAEKVGRDDGHGL